MALWKLHSLSANYHRPPSSYLGIADNWTAYQFDLTVLELGLWVENKLAERDKHGKPKHTLHDLLTDRPEQRFASLAGMVTRKVKIKPDGTWDE